MPKIAKELSAIEVRNLSTPGLHSVGTVSGLGLNITATGARSWILRTMVGSKRRDLGLGAFPEVSLAAAISKARSLKEEIKAGVDPVARNAAARAHVEWTFKRCAEDYIKLHRSGWKNAKHAQQWENTLETYAYPVIGALHVRDIGVPEVLRVIQPHWTTKNETMVRVRNRIEMILAAATVAKHRTGENPARWKHNLDMILPKPAKVNNRKSHPAVQIRDAQRFMAQLIDTEGVSALCLRFVMLTACRSNEARLAAWDEFDLGGKVWNIPGERMKSGRPHRVPLSPQVLELLASLPRFEGSSLLFPGRDIEKPISDMTMTQQMRRMEFKDAAGEVCVPHGLRSTFRDWASECTNYPNEVCEMALAHAITSGTEAAYRRGDLFEKRARLMADWATYATTKPGASNVTPLRTGTA